LQAGDTASFSRLAINDVADAYQYLSATGASPLLIEFDQGTLAERGASWLFARYLVDQYGPALPGKLDQSTLAGAANVAAQTGHAFDTTVTRDRKSTRLNSSHDQISYAVFCLKKKKKDTVAILATTLRNRNVCT